MAAHSPIRKESAWTLRKTCRAPTSFETAPWPRSTPWRDLLSQIGDPDAAHDAGVIDDDEYVERKARKLAYTSALAAYANGEVPDLPALLEQMREQASQPTQTETNTANIDYLLMTVGGDQ